MIAMNFTHDIKGSRSLPLKQNTTITELLTPSQRIEECLDFLRLRHFDQAEYRLDDLIRDSLRVAKPVKGSGRPQAPAPSAQTGTAAVLAGVRGRLASALLHTKNQRKEAAMADLQVALSRLGSGEAAK
jgi:hypothetical protein